MGKSLHSPKDIVRVRSEGMCEKCGVILTRNINGMPEGDSARSVHHRHPRRLGGRDSVVNLVNLCIGCHRGIHRDEEIAAKDGWIVIGRYPGCAPFLSWRGWVQPRKDGSFRLLDFDQGRGIDIPLPATTGTRHRVAYRQRHRQPKRGLRVA